MTYSKYAKPVIELILLIGSSCFAVYGIIHPESPYQQILALIGFIGFGGIKYFDDYKKFFTKKSYRMFSSAELIQHQEKLRPVFQEEIYKCRREKLRQDTIIRDVNRLSEYPATKEQKGISPWFKVGLVDTYHEGIQVVLSGTTLIEKDDKFFLADYGTENSFSAWLVGEIPYEYIEAVNFEGDEYYPYPHIYCYFQNKGEPYKRLIYCNDIDMGHGGTYYKEIAEYYDVQRDSRSQKKLS